MQLAHSVLLQSVAGRNGIRGAVTVTDVAVRLETPAL